MGHRPAWCVLGVLALGAAAPSANAQLLGVAPELPAISFNNTGTTMYDAASGLLYFDASTLAVRRSAMEPPRIVSASGVTGDRVFQIGVYLDPAGGLIGGLPGDDLYVSGQVDLDGDGVIDADGVLLTGEVTAFGFQDSGGPTDLYDLAITPTGGLLQDLFKDGYSIGVLITSEESTFEGDFTTDFEGECKGTAGNICIDEDIEVECYAEVVDVICDDDNDDDHRDRDRDRHNAYSSCTNNWYSDWTRHHDEERNESCTWSIDEDGVLVVKSDMATLVVSAMNPATGEVVDCETELCDLAKPEEQTTEYSTRSDSSGHNSGGSWGSWGWWSGGGGHNSCSHNNCSHNHNCYASNCGHRNDCDDDRDDDCRKLILVEFVATGGCGGELMVDAFIDIGCESIPVESGTLVELDCAGDSDHADDDDNHHDDPWWDNNDDDHHEGGWGGSRHRRSRHSGGSNHSGGSFWGWGGGWGW